VRDGSKRLVGVAEAMRRIRRDLKNGRTRLATHAEVEAPNKAAIQPKILPTAHARNPIQASVISNPAVMITNLGQLERRLGLTASDASTVCPMMFEPAFDSASENVVLTTIRTPARRPIVSYLPDLALPTTAVRIPVSSATAPPKLSQSLAQFMPRTRFPQHDVWGMTTCARKQFGGEQVVRTAASCKAWEGDNTAFCRVDSFVCSGDFCIAGNLLESNRRMGDLSARVGNKEPEKRRWHNIHDG
jgi:hypothetical protein